MLKEQEYNEYCKKYNSIEKYLRDNSEKPMDVALEICKLREYYPERMAMTLIDAGFMYLKEGTDLSRLYAMGNDFGLFKEDTFILKDRFIFPVKDMLGNTIALIGWFPDEKKYITTPSKLFSKTCLFYGMEQLSKTGIRKPYVLVEGIFDSLSVRSIGLNCIAQMGISTSRYKTIMYGLFSKLVGIPDNDPEGRKVLVNDEWNIPSNGKYFRWVGDPCKDIDNFINSYEEEDVREVLLNAFNSTERIVNCRV